MAGERSLSEEKYLELHGVLAKAVNREIDLIDLTAANGLILKQALSKGTVVLNHDKTFAQD